MNPLYSLYQYWEIKISCEFSIYVPAVKWLYVGSSHLYLSIRLNISADVPGHETPSFLT